VFANNTETALKSEPERVRDGKIFLTSVTEALESAKQSLESRGMKIKSHGADGAWPG